MVFGEMKMMGSMDRGSPSIVRRLLSTDVSDPMAETGIATLRVATGVTIATLHGWHKVAGGWDYFTTGAPWPLLKDTIVMGFPFPVLFTAIAAGIQLIGGCLLAIGALTRLAAFFLASTVVTALIFNLVTGGPDAQLAGLYVLITGAFVLIGGGRWSVDRRML